MKKSVAILDELNKTITRLLQSLRPSEKDFVSKSMRDLGFIGNSCLDSVARDFHDKYRVYPATSMTWLLIEIVATMKYIKCHSNEAEKYWNSQEEMHAKIVGLSQDDLWSMYTSGKANYIGKLESKTRLRIKSMLGDEVFGQYSFLNFYSHPNIAGYKHIVANPNSNPGVVMRFTVSIYIGILNEFINELCALTPFHDNKMALLQNISDAHNAYFTEVGLI